MYVEHRMFPKSLTNVFVFWLWFFAKASGEEQALFGQLTQGYFKKIENGKFMPCKCYFYCDILDGCEKVNELRIRMFSRG